MSVEGKTFEFGFPDPVSLCSIAVGPPEIGDPEGLLFSANYRTRQDSGNTFSFVHRADGRIQWDLFDELTGDEWFQVETGLQSFACVDVTYYSPDTVQRMCSLSAAGVASEDDTARRAFASFDIYCLFAMNALPEEPLDWSEGDPCTIGIPGPRGECLEFPRDSGAIPIECEREGGGLGMCVEGECAEHGCGGACDDGDTGTADRCVSLEPGEPLECQHEAF